MSVERRRAMTSPFAAILLLATAPKAALAHHAMGSRTFGTLVEALLSGLAHPVIELPHLAAILLAGALAVRVGRPAWIGYFVAGSFIGTAALTLDLPLSPSEALVQATPLLLAGFFVLRAPKGRVSDALALLAVGVVHGMAFAEAIVGAEPTPIVAYLVGLAVAELALAGLAAVATLGLFNVLRARMSRAE